MRKVSTACWYLIGFAVDRAQPLQEHRAIVLVGNAVFAVGVFGLLQQLVEDLDRVVVLALRLVDDGDVVLHLQRIGHDRSGLLQRFQRLIELAVAAIDLRNAHVGLRIRRIGIGDHLVLFQRGVGLAIVHQVLGQAANGIQIVVVQFGGSGDRRRSPSCSLSAARRCNPERSTAWPCARSRESRSAPASAAIGIAFFVVEIGQRGDGLFRIGLYLDRRLELALPTSAAHCSGDTSGPAAGGLPRSWDRASRSARTARSPASGSPATACRPACRPANADRCGPADGALPGCCRRASGCPGLREQHRECVRSWRTAPPVRRSGSRKSGSLSIARRYSSMALLA